MGAQYTSSVTMTVRVLNIYLTHHFSRDTSMCVEHLSGFWLVKPLSFRSQDANYALVEGNCALEACVSRVWKQFDGKEWHHQPGIWITIILDKNEIRHSDTPNLHVLPNGQIVCSRHIEAGEELTLDYATLPQ